MELADFNRHIELFHIILYMNKDFNVPSATEAGVLHGDIESIALRHQNAGNCELAHQFSRL